MFPILFLLAAAPAAPVEHATPAECAVIAAIGRARLGWTAAAPPDADFFPDYDQSGDRPGGGTYRQDCDWRALGLAPPRVGSPSSRRAFHVERPRFRAGGREAEAELTVSMTGDGPGAFLSTERCAVRRRGARWVLRRCEALAIT